MVWLHWMGGGTCILRELMGPQHCHRLNAFNGSPMEISGKFLIPKYGQALLKRQLKPVAAGNPITSPVMEILMGDYTFNALQFPIGGSFPIGQH